MLQAMLRGKLTRKEEGMEDLLTSNTFGVMKYVPWGAALLPFLRLATDPLSGHQLEDWLHDVACVDRLEFWPSIANPGCDPCEPDVEIVFRHRDGTRTLLLVEAKYRSGKSSTALDNETPPRDQLARELDNLRAMAEDEGIACYGVIFITADFSCPTSDIIESAREYRDKRQSDPHFYWLSWRMLPDVLDLTRARQEPMLKDLRDLMLRLNLVMFRRLRFEELRPLSWTFTRKPKEWHWLLHKPDWSFEKTPRSWSWGVLAVPDGFHFQKALRRFSWKIERTAHSLFEWRKS